jgi:hypothetical protein
LWRRTEKISWTDSVRIRKYLLHRFKEEMNFLHKIKEGRLIALVTSWAGYAF